MIETSDLTKVYGSLKAVNSLNLSLKEKDVFGFIGPNGAGKTTTMRILATLLQPSWGEASICGQSIYTNPREIRRLIGYMPDFFGVYDDMKVIEYLEFFAAAYRINGPERRKRCNEMLELVDLGYKRDALATSLSRGMTQRLGLARVLLHDPQVLLLDEPASGLDPRARIEIRQLLKRLRDMGKTIMVSSHILPELADVCNKIGIIERGTLLVNADVTDVMKQVRQNIVILVGILEKPKKGLDEAAKALESTGLTEKTEYLDDPAVGKRLRVTLKSEYPDYSPLSTCLIQNGFSLTHFAEEEINLETAFMALTKGITA
ncbi:MAG: ABC transporter ATP-binding protein [Thermoguttaceae bacterium]|nr:ABC transporter ATP-binding protein [Thermoguttaceae bacterium]